MPIALNLLIFAAKMLSNPKSTQSTHTDTESLMHTYTPVVGTTPPANITAGAFTSTSSGTLGSATGAAALLHGIEIKDGHCKASMGRKDLPAHVRRFCT